MDLALIVSASSSFLNGFDGFARWAAPAAVDGLWQGTAVAAGLAVCLRLAPRVSATHRFAAWAAGFGVAMGLPVLPLLAGLGSAATRSEAPLATGAAHAWLEFDARWSLVIAGLWLALSAYRAADLAVHTARLRRLWKSARPMEDWLGSRAAQTLKDVRGVEICITSELDRPSVIGFFAPRILIPEWLLKRLTRDELVQVILHEAEHLRRRDDWTNLVQKLGLVVFPLNPALLWMDRRLAKEREMACDEGVVRVTGAPRAYAACLANLAERGLENSLARDFARRAEALSLGAFERRPELVHRVHSILFGGKMLSPVAGRALLGALGCGLLLGSVELAQCPQIVAFVPERSVAPAQVIVAQTEASHAVRAEYAMAREDEGFRAITAMAMAPPCASRAAMDRAMPHAAGALEAVSTKTARSEETDAGKVRAGDLARTAPREELLKATVPASYAAQAAQPQEWLVVTAWQIQTTFRAQNVADYDTDTPESRDAKNRPAHEIAVTRMFLGVYGASQTAQAAGQAAGKPAQRPMATNTDLKTVPNQPAAYPFGAVPFGDGWLVIQL